MSKEPRSSETIQINDEPPFTLFDGEKNEVIIGEHFDGDVVFAGPKRVVLIACTFVNGAVSFFGCEAAVLNCGFLTNDTEVGGILATGGSLTVEDCSFTGVRQAVLMDEYATQLVFTHNLVDYSQHGIIGRDIRYMKADISNNSFHTADQAILLGGEGMTKDSIIENNTVAYSKTRFPNAPQNDPIPVDGQTPLIRMRELSANNVIRNNIMQPKKETWHGRYDV